MAIGTVMETYRGATFCACARPHRPPPPPAPRAATYTHARARRVATAFEMCAAPTTPSPSPRERSRSNGYKKKKKRRRRKTKMKGVESIQHSRGFSHWRRARGRRVESAGPAIPAPQGPPSFQPARAELPPRERGKSTGGKERWSKRGERGADDVAVCCDKGQTRVLNWQRAPSLSQHTHALAAPPPDSPSSPLSRDS